MTRTLLTKRRLRAIVEALDARLAGEIDVIGDTDAPELRDYESARDWADDELCKRESAQFN